jgi:hypothetical protein
MRGFAAVFHREVLTRRLVFAAAAAAGLVPIIVPLARGLHGEVAADERTAIAFIVAVAFALGMAIGLGVSMAAPAIANRQIAFDFARPLPGAAIWLGRLVAAAGLVVGAAAITLVPSLLARTKLVPGSDFVPDGELGREWPLLASIALVLVLGACHLMSVMLRSRSPLLLVDLLAGASGGLLVALVLTRLPEFVAPVPRLRVEVSLLIAAAAALLAASTVSVTHGRSDVRAAHRAASITLWTLIGAALVGVGGYAWWIRSASPRDLRGFWAEPASSGPWIALEGEARGARARFLFDTADGRFVRVYAVGPASPQISRDGRIAAWVDGGFDGGAHQVHRLALDVPGSKPSATRVTVAGQPWVFVLSPDGSRLATLAESVLSIHDLAAGRTLVSARIASADVARGFFADANRFRIFLQTDARNTPATLEVDEVDARAKSLRRGGTRELPGGPLYIVAEGGGQRAVAIEYSSKRVLLLDGATGQERAMLLDGATDTSRWPGFLADGRIIVSESSAGESRMRVFDPMGHAVGVVPLPGRRVMVGGEISRGRILTALGDGASWSTHLVDLDSGTIRKLADDAYPAARLGGFSLVLNASLEPGSDGTRLLVRHSDELASVKGTGEEVDILLRTRPGR